jgi:hypothetical protein
MSLVWKYLTGVAIMMFVARVAVAQTTPAVPGNELDKMYTPDKNSIFNRGEGSNASKSEDSPDIEFKNSIKFNVALLIRNTAAFFYERALSDVISIQVGLGNCYDKDPILTFSSASEMNLTEPNSTIRLYTIMDLGNVTSSGMFGSFSLKFYFSNYYNSNTVLDGGYFELGLRRSNLSLTIPSTPPPYSVDYPILYQSSVQFRSMSYYISWGYTFFTRGKIKTTHDFYGAIGIRNVYYSAFTSQEYQYTSPWGIDNVTRD